MVGLDMMLHTKNRIPLSAAEEIAEHLTVPVMMIEVHPTHERLEVGSVHLNSVRLVETLVYTSPSDNFPWQLMSYGSRKTCAHTTILH